MDPLLAAYLSVTALLVVTPGSTTAVVVRNTLIGGRGAGIAAAVGAALGNASHATAAGLGLAVALARWPSLSGLLRLGGGLYMAWLGAKSLYRAAKPAGGGSRWSPPAADAAPGRPRGASVREGVLTNLLNPSIAVFYLAVVPTFVPPGAPGGYFALLAAAHVGMAFACHSAWVFALDALQHVFQRPNARRMLEAATGVALLALAGRILAP